jgi:hypothetical protein
MTVERNEIYWDGKTERRKRERLRRRLVDLTLTRGTDRRKRKEDRREVNDLATERLSEKEMGQVPE